MADEKKPAPGTPAPLAEQYVDPAVNPSPTAARPEVAPMQSTGPLKPRSPMRIVLKRFLRNRAALAGLFVLVLLYLSAIFAAFLSPYTPYEGRNTEPDHPPQQIHFVDAQGHFHWRPFVYRYRMTDLLRRTYATDTSRAYPIVFFARGWEYKLWGLIPASRHLFVVDNGAADQSASSTASEARLHLLGTDRSGRDIFSRLLFGGQISLSIGVLGILITMSLGLLIGGMSGYFGGWCDSFLMRGVELLMSVPGLYMILALRAALYGDSPFLRWIFGLKPGDTLGSGQIYMLIIAILGLVGWGGTARVIRGMVLAVKELDYVSAARAMGASHVRIIVRHVLPNTMTYVIVSATLAVPGYILGEVALSFLGVGIEEPSASWGLMLQDGQNLRTLVSAPWVLVPGVMIFLTVFAFNFLGDGLRDALDPKATS